MYHKRQKEIIKSEIKDFQLSSRLQAVFFVKLVTLKNRLKYIQFVTEVRLLFTDPFFTDLFLQIFIIHFMHSTDLFLRNYFYYLFFT